MSCFHQFTVFMLSYAKRLLSWLQLHESGVTKTFYIWRTTSGGEEIPAELQHFIMKLLTAPIVIWIFHFAILYFDSFIAKQKQLAFNNLKTHATYN